ncbi:MAG: peptide deformylase [Planctomycetia bacterium]
MVERLEFDMTIYPAPVLRKPAEPVTAFDEELAEIVRAMFERMEKSNGVGLAAPQVGLRKRILILNHSGDPRDNLVLINPELISRSGPQIYFDEGCLSFPGIYVEVRRPERVRVRALDTSGKPFEGEYDGLISRIIQHEYDHLEGILLVDRMTPADKHKDRAALDNLVERHRRASEKAESTQ